MSLKIPRSMRLFPRRIEVEDIASKDIIIVVIGPTGAGKSSFINTATGGSEAAVGHTLAPVTHQVECIKCSYPGDKRGRNVVFVDTPAFNHTHQTESEIVKQISTWMAKTYNRKNSIAGIIYMLPISSPRMMESPLKHLKLFQQTCESYPSPQSIVLATTMWESVNQTETKAHEDMIREEYWKRMTDMGYPMVRFEDTQESAWKIVAQLLGESPMNPGEEREILIPKPPVVRLEANRKAPEEAGMPINEGPPSHEPYVAEEVLETVLAPSLGEVSSSGDETRSEPVASSKVGLLSNETRSGETAPLGPDESGPSLEEDSTSSVGPVNTRASGTPRDWGEEENPDGALHEAAGDLPEQGPQPSNGENFDHTGFPQDRGCYPPMTQHPSQQFLGAATSMSQQKIKKPTADPTAEEGCCSHKLELCRRFYNVCRRLYNVCRRLYNVCRDCICCV